MRKTKIEVAGNDYVNYEYSGNYITKTKFNDENDIEHEISTEVNTDGKILNVNYDTNTNLKTNIYNTMGNLSSSKDGLMNEQTDFEYDSYGKVLSKTVKDTSNNNAEKLKIENEYDDNDNVTSSSVTFGNNTQNYLFEYSKNLSQKLLKTTLSNVYVQDLSYDLLGRTKQVKTTFGQKEYTKQYSYLTKGNKTSSYIAAEWFGLEGINKAVIHYTYDSKGNITKIKHGGQFVVGYEYDELNRIVRENNKKQNYTKTYDYDAGGNILEARTYYFTINSLDDETPLEIKKYLYKSEGWRDQLMGYSIKTIDYENDDIIINDYSIGNYDSLGNPHKYNGNTMSWIRGRCLESYNGNNFEYNADGIRTKKNNTTYVLNGTKILSQSDGTNTLVFQYGANGVEGFTLNGAQYVYQKNILGDIIGIFDSNGNQIAKYYYDAWGNCEIVVDNTPQSAYNTNIAQINPFRYRGYYYDVETGFYYLNSRYYDPSICRFINADDISYANASLLNGLNLYAYCGNNPIINVDENGSAWWHWLIGGIIIVGLAIATIATGGAAGGVAGFILAGALKGAIISAVSGAVFGGVIGGVTSILSGNNFWTGFVSGAASGFMSGAITGAIIGAISSSVQIANAAKYWDKGSFSSGFKSMKYHYYEEVVKKSLTHGNSIIKYTNDAIKFANNNGVSFMLNLSRNGLQNSWSLPIYFGNGTNGLYTSLGKIITFHYYYIW